MKKRLQCVLLAFLASFSVFINGNISESTSFLGKIADELDGVGIEGSIVCIAFYVLFYKRSELLKKFDAFAFVIAVIFSAFTICGISYSVCGSWQFVFDGEKQLLIAMITFAGYLLIYYFLLQLFFLWFEKKNFLNDIIGKNTFILFVKKNFYWIAFLVILILWLPYIIVNLPGSVPSDGFTQLRSFFGYGPKTNHHPWIVSVFFGAIMSVGRNISDNIGVLLLVIALCIIEAMCYAAVCNKIRKWNAPDWLLLLSLIFYAVVPPFGAYAQAVIKDSLFFAVFALYMAEYIDICISRLKLKKKICIKKIVFFTLISIAVCFCRNNGVYMVLPANILLMFLVAEKRKRYVLESLICILVIWYGYNNIFLPMSNVEPGSKREMLSVPFQQTARYIQYYPDEITEHERKAISKVLDYTTISNEYNPELSDPVKNTYNEEATPEDLQNYFKVWLEMFIKHPGIYLEAFLNNYYGYVYPFYNCNTMGTYQFYIKWSEEDHQGLNLYYWFGENIRSIMTEWSNCWRSIPILAQIVNPGTYTWVLIVLTGVLLKYRKYKS